MRGHALRVLALPIAFGGCAQLFGISNTSPPPVDAAPDAPPGCGDGVIVGNEVCNGSNLGSATCANAVEPGWVGTLSCTAACALDTSQCMPPPTTWAALGSAANWSTFDVSTLYAGAKGFVSSVFDGRYLYLVPHYNGTAYDGLVVRYDTQSSLGASASWTSFDVSTVNPKAIGFQGGAWDGRYVYFVPQYNGAYDGVAVRLDTQAAGGFSAAASWTTFDVTTVNPAAAGFVHAAFDGRYVYYSPYYNGTAYDGVAARYDTQATGGFGSAASWETFDVSTLNASAKGFLAAVFDGRYVYLVPYYNGTAYHGVVAQFDTKASGGFGSAASWTAFNMATINASAAGFYAGAFDGRYVYFGQQYTGAAYGGLVMQFDTQATGGITAAASWASFNAAALPGGPEGFVGAVFDGRYVYFTPNHNATAYDGVVARYDTTAAFGSASSWESFDASTLSANATGFDGAGFDGSAVYFIPNYNGAYDGLVVRFAAKTPLWLPLGWNSQFD